MWGWLISLVGGKVLSASTWWAGPLLGLVIAAAVAYGGYRIYDMGGDAREDTWKLRLVNLESQHKEELLAKDQEIALIRSQRDTEIVAMTALLHEQQRFNEETLADLARKLQATKERINALAKIKPQEVIRYVTTAADRACTIPAGFVFLHDQAASADAAKASGDGTAPGAPRDVDAPSGVALSSVSTTVSANYGEAIERGTIIELWQAWYRKVQASFEDLRTKYDVLVTVPKPP